MVSALGVHPLEFRPYSLPRFGLVVDHEEIAADTIHVRLDDAHDSIGRDRCVDGIAALFENVSAGLRCQKLRG